LFINTCPICATLLITAVVLPFCCSVYPLAGAALLSLVSRRTAAANTRPSTHPPTLGDTPHQTAAIIDLSLGNPSAAIIKPFVGAQAVPCPVLLQQE
jgi:hypothetical protein